MFKSGTLTAGIDEDDDAIFAELLGKTVDEETGVVVSNVNDVPIYVGFGHIVPKAVLNFNIFNKTLMHKQQKRVLDHL